MFGDQVLPEGLAELPPGPQLGAALAALDLTRCTSADLHTVLGLQSRQLSYEQARLWDVLLETAYAQSDVGDDASSRVRELDEFSGSQTAFTLVWSRPATLRQLDVAQDLIERLPMVFSALRAGRIDPVRAKVFSEALRDLDDETARRIAAGLVEKAARWTAAQLREKLRHHVLKADPSLAKKRQQRCVADRRVYNRPYTDGTAELAGINLPPHLAAAAYDRLNRLAKAAHAAGDIRSLGQLRADAYLDLLIGKPFTLRPSTDPFTREADAAGREEGLGLDNDCGDEPQVPQERRHPQNRPATGFWERRSDSKATRDGARHNPHDRQDQPAPNSKHVDSTGTGTGAGPRFPVPNGEPGQSTNSSDSAHRFPTPDPESEPIGAASFDPADDQRPADLAEMANPGLHANPDPPPPGRTPPGQTPPGKAPPGAAPPGEAPPASGVDPVRGSDDPRTCTCGGIQPAPRRGQVDIHIEATTLMCLNDNPALIPGWGSVIADIARLSRV